MFFFFWRLACTWEETWESVWPPYASLYANSTCINLRPLAGPFGQGLKLQVSVISLLSWPLVLNRRRATAVQTVLPSPMSALPPRTLPCAAWRRLGTSQVVWYFSLYMNLLGTVSRGPVASWLVHSSPDRVVHFELLLCYIHTVRGRTLTRSAHN